MYVEDFSLHTAIKEKTKLLFLNKFIENGEERL